MPRAVFIGRLAPEKGLDTLIRAWPIVRASYPHASLTLIGDGPQKKLLEHQAKVLGLRLGPEVVVSARRVVTPVSTFASPTFLPCRRAKKE